MNEDGKVFSFYYHKGTTYLKKLHKNHKEVLHQSQEHPSEVKLMALLEGDSIKYKHHRLEKGSTIH